MNVGPEIWVAPAFDGPITGGTIYNARLVDALERRGMRCERLDVNAARVALSEGRPARYWVDSLYLDRLPDLARQNRALQPLGIVVHYLPSLLTRGEVLSESELLPEERAAIGEASNFLTTSSWMGLLLERVGVPPDAILVVEPGTEPIADVAGSARTHDAARESVAALMVANAVPGKGIAPFMTELARIAPSARAGGALELTIVGSLELDGRCAELCRDLAARDAWLRGHVHFAGAVPYAELGAWFCQSDVVVSASRMESYGMALAGARAAGIPILARRGGNVAAHVRESSGGSLFDDDTSLAAALVRLSEAPAELEERSRRARGAIFRRSWDDAARDFAA